MKLYNKGCCIRIAAIVFLTAVFASCKKSELLDKTPVTSLDNTKALVTEADYVALTNAAYDPLQWQENAELSTFPVMFQDIRADNCVSQWASYWTYGTVFDDFSLIKPNNPTVLGWWQKWYTVVSRANTAIRFDSAFSGFTTPGLQARLIAEAKFLRAFAYFQLVINFGDVPLITTYIGSTDDQTRYPRSPKAEVYAQIEKDLLDAVDVLPESYSGNDIGRATSGAAYTLLAKASLYQKKYDQVRTYCEKVIDSRVYSLETNFADNWSLSNEYGKESIFEIGYQSGFATSGLSNQGSFSYEYFGFIPAGLNAFGNCVPREPLIELYDNDDTRKDATFIVPSTYLPDLGMTAYDAGTQYYYTYWTVPAALESQASVRKYYIPKQVAAALPTIASSPLNEKIFRYADVLLMHAEAAVMGAGGDGLASLNQVIQRAYGNASHDLTSYTLDDVKLQRRLELATEGWDRFTDLVRWGDAATVLAFKHFQANRDEVLPIPQSEIDLVGSAVLTQNPGY
jgi:hypothetical protein